MIFWFKIFMVVCGCSTIYFNIWYLRTLGNWKKWPLGHVAIIIAAVWLVTTAFWL